MSELDEPLYPERHWVDDVARAKAAAIVAVGSGPRRIVGPVRTLDHWVRGGAFHRYGFTALDQLLQEHGMREALEVLAAVKPKLRFESDLRDRGLRWSVMYQRAGDPDAYGLSSGPSTVEDVAYSALSMIEEHEREVYEQTMMVGLA